jgi:hypothetical protein
MSTFAALLAQQGDWKTNLDAAQNLAKFIALIVAGIWAYFNFVKSRTYHPRMELEASGEIRIVGRRRYLVPRFTLKNIGRSKIDLIQRGSGYRIWTVTEESICNSMPEREDTHPLSWAGGKIVYKMFEAHGWIEPGESIFDEGLVVALPPDCIAAKVQARLVGQVRRYPRKKNSEWNNSVVLGPIALPKEDA